MTRSFTISKVNQTIAFAALAGKTFGDADFNVSATSTSGLVVSFGATGACTVTGTLVHITGGGSCTITASQGGNGTYAAAPSVPQSFSIAKAGQTISFGTVPTTKLLADPDFTVTASATSGLPVTLTASGSCTITGIGTHHDCRYLFDHRQPSRQHQLQSRRRKRRSRSRSSGRSPASSHQSTARRP